MEQLDYNLLFRWFVGLAMDAPIWDVTVFTKNRERLLAGDVAARFLSAVMGQSRVKALLSDEHFSVDGTLIEAWASMKSFKPKGGVEPDDNNDSGCPGAGQGIEPAPQGRNAERNFRGESRLRALIPTASEITTLLAKLLFPPPRHRGTILEWSLWRRRHQLSAAEAHYRRRSKRQL